MNKGIALIKKTTRESMIIAKKELVSYFSSPVAYIIITLFVLFTGILFFRDFYVRGQADMRPFFDLLPLMFAIFIPALTMKLLAEEKSSGSFELLVTMPFTTADILTGKFIAAVSVVAVMLAPTFLYVVTIALSGSIDLGPVIGGYLGALLMAAAYSAVGIFASSLTRNQIVAFIISFTICFVFTVLDYMVAYLPGKFWSILQYVGTGYHFRSIARGVIDSRDLIYFASAALLFLLAAAKSIDERR
jgi:ABC-2 type transport system permease protein